MSSATAWLWDELAPHALVVARLAPITFLCPILGGAAAPPTVRLGVALTLAAFMVRICPGASVPAGLTGFTAALLLEVLMGLAIGLASAAPFDAARVAGRFVDLARGSSAEASLPHAGSKETATGDLLYQLLVALAAAGLALPSVVGALARGFAAVPPGHAALALVDLDAAISVTGGVLATGLAVAAPVWVACLLADAALALCARLGPSFCLNEQAAGVRLLFGALAFWIGVDSAAGMLLETAVVRR